MGLEITLAAGRSHLGPWWARLGAAVLAVIASAGTTGLGSSARADVGSAGPPFRYGTTAPGPSVDPIHPPGGAAAVHRDVTKPRRGVPPDFYPTHPAAAAAGETSPSPRLASETVVSGQPVTASGSAALQLGSSFPAMSYNRQSQTLNVAADPPDTQMAVGPTYIAEAVNVSLSIWRKDGSGPVVTPVDLDSFFAVPSNYYFSDPRIEYDSSSGRFYMSGLGYASTGSSSLVYVAVSSSSDPTASWKTYTLSPASSSLLHDQPKLGFSDDKVALGWDNYSGQTFQNDEWAIIQKSDLLAASTLHVAYASSANRFGVFPAQSLSGTAIQYLVENRETALAVLAVSGTPSQGNVTTTVTTVSSPTTSAPPAATQPSSAYTLDMGDDRVLNAVWQSGTLWASSDNSCQNGGHSCGHLMQLQTAGTGCPCLGQVWDVSLSGGDVGYPAVTMDASGDLVYTATEVSASSSSPVFPSMVVGAQPAGITTAPAAPTLVATGRTAHSALTLGDTVARWGDYEGAAVDPSSTGTLWLAGEAMTDGSNSNDWTTTIGQATVQQPAPPSPVNLAGVVGSNNGLFSKRDAQPYAYLGGYLLAAPALVAVPSSSGLPTPLYIGEGTDHRLYVRSDSVAWQDLIPGGAVNCNDSPGAVVTPASGGGYTLTVACEGSDQGLYYWQGSVSSNSLPSITTGSHSLGGVLFAGPAVAVVPASGGGQLTFFAETYGRALYSRTISTGYVRVPANCVGHPAVASNSATAYLACQGLDGSLDYSVNSGGGWSAVTSAGGQLVDGPGISLTSQGATTYVEGTNQGMFHVTINLAGTGTSAWAWDGGVIQFGAAAVGLSP